MKTITCRQLGGQCDAPITASTFDELMTKGMDHLREAHPEMAADVEKTPKDDPTMVKWMEDTVKLWADTPDM